MSPFLQLLLALTIIITAAKAGGWLSQKLRQPAVLGELLAGLLLGPSLIDLVHAPTFSDPHIEETIVQLAELGVICLMFVAGLEIDIDEMLHSGRVSILAGSIGVIVPLALGALTALLFGFTGRAALFVGIILSATSVSISAQTLIELGQMRRRESIALLGAAVIDDVLVIVILSVFTAIAGGAGSAGELINVLIEMVIYLVVATLISLFVLPSIAAWVHRQSISEGLTAVVLVAAMLFAWSAEAVGRLAAITGAFIAGIGLARSHLREEIERGFRPITYGFLVPIFFVSIGLRADTHALAINELPFALLLTIVAIVAKVAGCGLGAQWGGFAWREALRVGAGMISRGEVGLIVASVGLSAGLIGQDAFAVVVIIVLTTTLITPILLRWAFNDQSGQSLASRSLPIDD